MKIRHTTLLACAIALIVATSALAKPHIVIVATGGTIAGAQPDKNAAGYVAGSFSVENLIEAAPQMKDIAEITGEQLVNIGSQNMNNEVWLKLARRVSELLAEGGVDGVVITHGTDTMEETGYFLSLVVKSDKPIVLVGSMRPATAVSADGPANLFNGVAVACSPGARGRGPLVVINDEIHYAREVQKQNATSLDTFKSPNRGRAGLVNTGKATFFAPLQTLHGKKSELSIGDEVTEMPKVDIVYAYANMGGDLIEDAVDNGCKGIVLCGVGDGNATEPAINALKEAAAKGVVVVRCSRTASGVVARNIELNDDELGFVAGMELNAQKARVLLMLGLMQTSDVKAIQTMFETY